MDGCWCEYEVADGARWNTKGLQTMGVEKDITNKQINVTKQNVPVSLKDGTVLEKRRENWQDRETGIRQRRAPLSAAAYGSLPGWTQDLLVHSREKEKGRDFLWILFSPLNQLVHSYVGLEKVKGHIFLGLTGKVKMLQKEIWLWNHSHVPEVIWEYLFQSKKR